jgi:Spy/CpxP family protein refolding chaperone
MSIRSTLVRTLVGLFWLAAVAPTAAQPARQPRPLPAPGPGAGFSPAEVQRWFDAFVLVQAQQVLDLGGDQYAKFVTAMRSLQEVRRRNQQERMRLVRELARLSGPQGTGDEPAIQAALASLKAHDAKAVQELEQAYAAVDAVLTPRQRARFRVFEDNMERRKLELLLRARQRQAGRGQGGVR